jgi:DNA-binding transcriptional regulator YdaS (Cro superfamily)
LKPTDNNDDWLTVLREQCDAKSQAKVAKLIRYSPAVVNQVLKGTYKGDVSSVQRAVEGALMGLTVECPVIGQLARNQCLEIQRRPFAATNHLRVQLSRACPTCPNRRNAL